MGSKKVDFIHGKWQMANGNGNGTQKLLGEEKEDSLSLQFNAGICKKERNFNMGDPERSKL